MPTTERTYSFRAASDLHSRVDQAVDTWVEVRGPEGWPADDVFHAFSLELRRRFADFETARGNQSALFRLIAEAFATAAERVQAGVAATREYEAWASEDEDARDVRTAALRSATDRWREG